MVKVGKRNIVVALLVSLFTSGVGGLTAGTTTVRLVSQFRAPLIIADPSSFCPACR